MARLEFWLEYASTYSYLSAMRIDDLATQAGVEVVWRPFLLGPIFKAQGWSTSPFNLYLAKGRYMIRDLERLTAERDLPFTMPDPFPANTLLAARIASVGAGEGWIGPFSKAVFTAEFATGADIADRDTLERILTGLGLDGPRIMALSGTAEIKERLRDATAHAHGAGIFGAPSFVTSDGDLYWGDDRLEQALRAEACNAA